MNFKNITLKNVSDFIEGYSNWFLDKYLPKHKREQILYRASQCPPECFKENKCKFCGCDYPQKLYVNKSCNKDKNLPDLMEQGPWEEYKQKLKIEKATKLP
jgi:hypothetical protein